MVLEFKLKNFKSFREEAVLSLSSETSKLKPNNVHTVVNEKGQKFRVSKASVIYGANASGKSNLIKALAGLIDYIVSKPSVGDKISIYGPFSFDMESLNRPTNYQLIFLGPSDIKFDYKIKVSSNAVLEESLDYFPEGRRNNLFKRSSQSESAEKVEEYTIGHKKYAIFSNQSLLSKFGEEPHTILTEVYLYFKNKFNTNASAVPERIRKRNTVKILMENERLKESLTQLLRVADTKIDGIDIELEQIQEAEDMVSRVRNVFRIPTPSIRYIHDMYMGDSVIEAGGAYIPIELESMGSQILFTLGTDILRSIQMGQIMIVDELDSSLHPFVTKLLVMLFLSSKINTKGAQLIFNTHDVTLLDETLFRKDQVWFVEKNEKGESDLYALSDFEKLREDTPFEKWYLAGKFGGLPNIDSIESIFSNESAH